MNVNKKQGKLINDTIDYWKNSAIIDNDTSQKLRDSIKIRPFDWKRLAKYSFWVSIACIIISVSAVLADNILIQLIEKIFTSSSVALCISFLLNDYPLSYTSLPYHASSTAAVISLSNKLLPNNLRFTL